MKVRKLEWVDVPSFEYTFAGAIAGTEYNISYNITRRQLDEKGNVEDVPIKVEAWLHFNGEYDAGFRGDFDTVEEAKLACQEHFNKMILSQLSEHMDV